jgi:hypothetical protein
MIETEPVPPEYIGVWKRTLLRTPRFEDTTSRVYWLQTRDWHADVRVPAERPACKGEHGLQALERDELLGLAAQQGFAGITAVEGDICRWLRRYDFQPPTGANDVGRMEFETADRLLEYGVEADYFEIWERVPGSVGSASVSAAPGEPRTLLLSAGRFRMRVRPRANALPRAAHLAALVARTGNADLRALLDFEISFGERSDPGTWRIAVSTLPWLEGTQAAWPS